MGNATKHKYFDAIRKLFTKGQAANDPRAGVEERGSTTGDKQLATRAKSPVSQRQKHEALDSNDILELLKEALKAKERMHTKEVLLAFTLLALATLAACLAALSGSSVGVALSLFGPAVLALGLIRR